VRRLPDTQVKSKVEQMLKLVHLGDCRDRMPDQLSGGMQQRVAIARALAYDPPVLLMDEPLSALDKKLREELQTELRRIHQQTGVTILYVTHDQEEALRLSDRIAVFNKGRIEQVGSGEELYAKPASRFVASFIGNSNFLPVTLAGSNGSSRAVFPNGKPVSFGGFDHALNDGDNGALMLRPEQIRIRAQPSDVADVAGGGLLVIVRDVTYLGDTMHYAVATPWEQEIAVRTSISSRAPSLAVGARAWLEWENESARLFAA
jgi:putative spermidine/putrescine transport system ATP-binding protein